MGPTTAKLIALGTVVLGGCSIQITDQTPASVPGNATGVYEVSAQVTPSGSSVDVLDVTALVDGSPFPLSNSSGNLWSGVIGISPCQAGYELVYSAHWKAPFKNTTVSARPTPDCAPCGRQSWKPTRAAARIASASTAAAMR